MKYKDTMNYIKNVSNFGSNYGLERTFRLLELLGNPQNDFKIIHIAGTNGKGSTTSMISNILKESGFKVGMYTSPFLEEFEERIQINNANIEKEELINLVDKIRVVIDRVLEEGYSHPTEFEMITVIMLLYFSIKKVDFAVIEVGLGGTLDSTNVVEPIISVITSISLDHTNLLGNTLGEIAGEKAGIIKKDTPIVIFPQKKEAYDEIVKKSIETKSKIYEIDKDNIIDLKINKNTFYQEIKLNSEYNYDLRLPLLGKHQIYNMYVAIKTIEVIDNIYDLNISKENIESGISKVKWKGRLEVLKSNPLVVIDAAHNLQGISILKENIKTYFKYNDLYLIIGILADKDVESMIKIIAPLAKKIYAVTPNSERASLACDLKLEIIKYNENCNYYLTYEEAYEEAYEDAKEKDLILSTGSIYMIGGIRQVINRKS